MKQRTVLRLRTKARLKLLFPRMGLVGLSIALADKEGLTDYQNLGFAHKERRAAAGEDTLYGIGSAGMTITAALLALLHDEGRLCLDDPVIRHMPDFQMKDPESAKILTLRDILAHQSGVRDSEFFRLGRSLGRKEILAFFAESEPFCPMRRGYGFCMIGYALIGLVIEQVSGMAFADFARIRLFEPLGMSDTGYGIPEGTRAATGYITLPDGTHPSPPDMPPGLYPACGLVSTARDMTKWLAFCLREGEPFLSADAMRLLTAPLQPVSRRAHLHPQISVFSACGWRTEEYRDHRLLTCGGGGGGFAASLILIPSAGLGIALLSNSSGAGHLAPLNYLLTDRLLALDKIDWHAVFRQYWQLLMAPQRELRADIRRRLQDFAPAPGCRDAYPGVFSHSSGLALELVPDGDSFFVRLGGLSHRFTHVSGSDFVLTSAFPEQYGVKYNASVFTDAQGCLRELCIWLDPTAKHPMVFTRAALDLS